MAMREPLQKPQFDMIDTIKCLQESIQDSVYGSQKHLVKQFERCFEKFGNKLDNVVEELIFSKALYSFSCIIKFYKCD